MKYFLGEIKYFINFLFSNDTKLLYIKELRRNGITVIPNFLTEEECKFHADKINSCVKTKKTSWNDLDKSDVRIFGYEKLVKEASNLFIKIDFIYKSYISKIKRNSFLMANRVCFKKSNKGSGGGWHRDSLNRRQLKFMIYLNDVNDKNGAFEYVPKTHTAKNKFITNHFLTKKTRYTDSEMENYKKTFPSKLYTAKKGTCIIFDSSGLHRGTPLRDEGGVRYAITKYMFDSNIPKHIQKLIIEK